MKYIKILILYFLFFSIANSTAQNGFRFLNQNKKVERVKFKLINNLIVIPVTINNKKLSFILDTGVSKNILFNISQNDSIGLNNVRKVNLRGLGSGDPVEALLSKNNKFAVKNLVSFNEDIYVIIKDYFDFSSKMGITVNGILGYNLLKNFVVKINYKNKYIDFYNASTFTYKKCRKCETFPLQFYRNKPFVDVQVQLDTIGNALTNVKLLIDSGGSDAIWLFEYTKNNIVTPKRYFKDILGEGLSGSIYGNRSRIPNLKLGNFKIKEPTVSFLDTISTKNARSFKERNGSLGGDILKRFVVWLDYPNKKMTLKKSSFFKNKFNYNMSGLEVVYNGMQLVKERDLKTYTDSYNQNVSSNNSISFITSFSYKFKPSYRIKSVVIGSPAYKAGLKKGDIIRKINSTPVHELKLSNIIQKFQEKKGKKIRMIVIRNNKKLKFQFRLERKI